MKCFGKTENIHWQDRLHRIRANLTMLATEDCELLERHLLYRVELHQIEQRQEQVQEQRRQLQAEITSIEGELGLRASDVGTAGNHS